ncbi:MAG TPA: S4 domain-containing protein, partial [Candidatus Limnocylindrales bacterium]|nr:S4 domain-containing protein [Candidatus Limnocylindrales bacterium]
KMGKSEKGAVMLDPSMTSPYDFYQYWLNDDDSLAVQHLRWLTLMTADQVADIERQQSESPERRPAQRALAYDLTARIHGNAEADRQVRVADAAFAGGPINDPEVLDALFGAIDHFEFGTGDAANALDLAAVSGLATSRSEARRLITQGGMSINDVRVTDIEASLPEPVAGRYFVLRAGRKRLLIARLRG